MTGMQKLDLNVPPTVFSDSESEGDGLYPLNPHSSKTAVDPKLEINNNQKPMKKPSKKSLLILVVIAIVAGVGSGYALNNSFGKNTSGMPATSEVKQVSDDAIKDGAVFGSADADTFKDSAQGYLEAGGLDGEGSHKLLRIGGETQTVYLTSSVVDLDKLIGMEVKVAGETFKGQKAGWLMDVGRVEVIKVKGESPLEE